MSVIRMRRVSSRRLGDRRRRGQALVEFALVAPLFFLLLFAVIEAARFTFYYETLNNATREGARYAIVHGSHALDGCPSGPPAPDSVACDVPGTKVLDAARNAAFGLASTGSLSANLPVWSATSDIPSPGDLNTGNNKRGNYVTVFLDYTYAPILPLLPSITISARSSLVINN